LWVIHSFLPTHAPKTQPPPDHRLPPAPPVRGHPKFAEEGKKLFCGENPQEYFTTDVTRGAETEQGRDVCAVRGARGPGARRAPGAGLPSPPGDLCVLAPSAPAAGARRRAHTRRGAIVPSFSGSRRAANRRLGREGCRPGRRVLPRQGARPRLFLASWDMVAAP